MISPFVSMTFLKTSHDKVSVKVGTMEFGF